MYADTTTSRVHQHRAAMEKHAAIARQAKAARAAAPRSRTAPAQRGPQACTWSVAALVRRVRSAGRPVTV